MKTKIVTFGEILLRLSKPGYQRLFQGHHMFGNYGGSEANAAISLAYLGDNVEYVTRVPYGEMGEAALMHLREYGLNVSHVVRGGERLGTYYFEEAVAMRNSRVVYDRKNSSFYTLKRGMVKWDKVLADAAVFHCSGITCAISRDAMESTMDAIKLAVSDGLTIACDINYRKNLWGMALGLNWAKHSRLKRADGKEEPYMGEKKEFLVRFAKQYMQGHKDIDYFMFGHRHIELDLMLSKKTRLMILGDWIWQFTYAVFDGEHMFMEEYVEGESQP
jgi:hypothetical protein